MSFDLTFRRLANGALATAQAVFVQDAIEVHRSVQTGSELTGAPGQPVDTATLRDSWQLAFESDSRAVVSTNVEYAEAVEDGIGPHGPRVYGAKNGVGGSHSVAMTVANVDRIHDAVVSRVTGRGA